MTPTRYALIALSTLALIACNKNDADDRTAGQKVDAAIEKVDDKAEAAKADIERAAEDAKKSATDTAKAATAAVSDAAITASIKTGLATDNELKAMDIDVDTRDGHTALHGTAPNVASRDRATRLASGVNGVVSVDNQLSIKP